MLKKIIPILFLISMFIPVSASYPESAYQVPWAQGSVYVISNVDGTLYALVSTDNTTRIVEYSGKFYVKNGGHSLYKYMNNQWSLSGSVDGFTWGGVPLSDGQYITPNKSGFVFNSTNLIANSQRIETHTGIELFPQALFQLQLTPSQIRERATEMTLAEMIPHISTVLSVILPIGLLVLSSLLAIPLIRRFLVYLGL